MRQLLPNSIVSDGLLPRLDAVAAIFWLKVRAGWKEASALKVGGPDGGPIRVVISAEDAGVL